ncbi:hypothetical protein EVAR_26589_1 [Eumeta japonica]|uniref:RNase H type-1 domain-containing protein n=1 Tax=Eumeta variegata TaxID=151549 RepID=A0A4C1W7I9_EUMVA|nr:hypothetical protein EVAR_26589_1 [Eumeta japonica]
MHSLITREQTYLSITTAVTTVVMKGISKPQQCEWLKWALARWPQVQSLRCFQIDGEAKITRCETYGFHANKAGDGRQCRIPVAYHEGGSGAESKYSLTSASVKCRANGCATLSRRYRADCGHGSDDGRYRRRKRWKGRDGAVSLSFDRPRDEAAGRRKRIMSITKQEFDRRKMYNRSVFRSLQMVYGCELVYVIVGCDKYLARCASGYRGVLTAFCVLAQLLQYELRNVEVILQWVSAHIGICGNEEADKLANTAHLSVIEYPISSCYSEVLSLSRDKRQCKPLEYSGMQATVNTRDSREVTIELPAFWVGIEYPMGGRSESMNSGGVDKGRLCSDGREVGQQNSHSLYETQQRKLLLHTSILCLCNTNKDKVLSRAISLIYTPAGGRAKWGAGAARGRRGNAGTHLHSFQNWQRPRRVGKHNRRVGCEGVVANNFRLSRNT